ncbi:hypothetical protein GCM10009555_079160 [Acrocarpospora macrocephala]|uniref:Antitoxin Xre/MbcA/ParS-like toxin-binding domain-containing protein n=1 Tax=Acrocarpospora macrocephala TaxID=150177 RepID=A0A5M3XA03_9ACTN|nr:hypothetical protein [Acrocarpospora macrocephala]GES16331.1 hypothetical protein Amac_099290 [Acrocarpospora macrocephala]
MRPPDLARYVMERLDEIRDALDPAIWAQLLPLLDQIAVESEENAEAAWYDLLELIQLGLPRGHEIRRTITEELSGGYRSPAADTEIAATLDVLRAMLPDLARISPPEGIDDDIRRVRDRLRATPSLTPDEVRARGGDPAAPDLLRLPGPGGVTIPAFQFGPDGTELPAVRAVNEILAAGRDPWGAAHWWLRGNALLGDIPASLVAGRPGDVIEAAQTLREEY